MPIPVVRSPRLKAGSQDKTFSYQVGDIIENQAEIKKIQRAKLIFFNQNNSRLEYIVIPEEKIKLNISYKQERKNPGGFCRKAV